MKFLPRHGVMALCAAVFTLSIAGCSRNVASEGDIEVTQNPAPATPTVPETPSPAKPPEVKPQSVVQEHLTWEPSLDAALKKARETQKPIMIDFFATWCGPCKMLDAEIYPAPSVVTEGMNFISVKVDVDKEAAIAQKYQISAMPTIVFLSASGQEIHRTQGVSQDPAWMVQEMQTARAKVAPTAA